MGLDTLNLINQVQAKLYLLRLAINLIMWNQGKWKLKFILRRHMLKIILMSLKIRTSLNLNVFIVIQRVIPQMLAYLETLVFLVQSIFG